MRPRAGLRRRLTTAALGLALIGAPVGASVLPTGAAHAADLLLVTGLSTTTGPDDLVPTFSWVPTAGASLYRVQVSANADFTGPVVNATTSNTSYTPPRVLPAGQLHWRVQTATPVGEWAVSTVEAADVKVPQPAPEAGDEVVRSVVDPLVAKWDEVQGAVGYAVEVGPGAPGDIAWAQSVTKNTRTTTLVWPDLQEVGQYSWRVRALFANGIQSQQSNEVPYTVVAPDMAVTAACAAEVACAPEPDGTPRPDVTLTDVVLDWDPVPGAKQYQVRVVRTADASTVVDSPTVTGTRYSPTSTYANDDYRWQVRPLDASGKAAPWPEVWSTFTRSWNRRPELLWPAGDDPVGDDFYFQWTPVKHAAHYLIDVGNDPNFTPGTYSTCETRQTTFVPRLVGEKCSPSAEGSVYHWRVTAVDAPKNVRSLVSPTGRFLYDSGRVEQLRPATGESVDLPHFTWRPTANTQRYRIQIKQAGNVVTTAETSALGWVPTDKLAAGDYTWTVVSLDAGKVSPLPSQGRPFTITGDAPPANGSALAPITATTDNPISTSRAPLLSWEPADGAAYYRLKVSNASGYVLPNSDSPVLNAKLPYPMVVDWGTRLLTAGTYTWWVEAYAANNEKIDTGARIEGTFTIVPLQVPGGTQLALDGRSVDAGHTCTEPVTATNPEPSCRTVPGTPVLDWDPVPGAGGYIVYLFEEASLTTPVLLTRDGETTTNSRWTPATTMPDNESGQSYYWYVLPCVSVSPLVGCAPDPRGQENVAVEAFRKTSPAVELVAPAADHTFSDEVTLSWRDYLSTNAETAFGATPSRATQGGLTYTVQVATSSNFASANIVGQATVDQTTWTSSGLFPQGDLWWRVQANDGSGRPLPWSASRRMVRRTLTADLDGVVVAGQERASLTTPGFNGGFDSSRQVFRWEAADFDSTWSLEVYKNDDAAASPGNRVLTVSGLKHSAYTWTNLLEPSEVPYRWRLRRTDVSNRLAAWSDMGRFTVTSVEQELISPTNGSVEEPSGPVFRWAAVPGAANYDLTFGLAAPNAPMTTQRTPALTWSTTAPLKGGTYTWTVKALNADNEVISTSAARSFTVDAGLTAVTAPVISAPEGSAVGRTLTSTPPRWSPDPSELVTNTYQWLADDQVIRGATAPTFTVTTAQYGRTITLRVTGKRHGYTDGVATSAGIVGEAGDALVAVERPVLAGTAAYGQRLTVTAGVWSESRAKISYQWLRNGANIPGATSYRYTVTAADAAQRIQVRVMADKVGLARGSTTSNTLTVAKLTSTAELSASTTVLKKGKKLKLTARVLVPGVTNTFSGTLTFKDRKKKLKVAKLGKYGTTYFSTKKLKPGTHKLRLVYSGNSTTRGSKSTVVQVKITR